MKHFIFPTLIFVGLLLQPITFSQDKYPEIGKHAPSISITEWIQGKDNESNPFSGKTIILEFWGTWCGPCRLAIPHLNDLATEFKNSKFLFLSITDEEKKTVEDFLKIRVMKSAVALDTGRATFDSFGIRGVPHTFIIDDKGLLRWHGYPLQLSKEILHNYITTGKLPPPITISKTDTLTNFTVDNLFTLTIERLLSFDVNSSRRGSRTHSQTLGDKFVLEYQEQPLKDILISLMKITNARLQIDGNLNDEILNVSMKGDKPMYTQVAEKKTLETLCEMFNIKIDKVFQQRKGYKFVCTDPGKLIPNEFKSSSSYSDSANWRADGVPLSSVTTTLESIYDVLIFQDSPSDQKYDFVIPIGNFKQAKKELETNYGVLLEETIQNVEVTVVKSLNINDK